MIYSTGDRIKFIGNGTGRNCVDAQIGPADDRKTIDFRGRVGTILNDGGRSGVMDVKFDEMPNVVWTMAKDDADFENDPSPAGIAGHWRQDD
jgi:hypothetical protein